MRKKLLALLILICLFLTFPAKGYAKGYINEAEAAILGYIGSTFEKDGHYWSLKAEYGAKADAYCMREDVDLTWGDYESVKGEIFGYINTQYFDIVGDVPGYNQPSEPTNPTPSEPENPGTEDPKPQPQPQPQTPKKDVSDNESKKEETPAKSTDVTSNDVTSNDISENDVSRNEPFKIDLSNVVKVPENFSTDVSGMFDEVLNPSKDYSDQEPPKKTISGGLIAGIIIGVTVIASGSALFIHKRKSRKRFK